MIVYLLERDGEANKEKLIIKIICLNSKVGSINMIYNWKFNILIDIKY